VLFFFSGMSLEERPHGVQIECGGNGYGKNKEHGTKENRGYEGLFKTHSQ
jgi:hypothetical protein